MVSQEHYRKDSTLLHLATCKVTNGELRFIEPLLRIGFSPYVTDRNGDLPIYTIFYDP